MSRETRTRGTAGTDHLRINCVHSAMLPRRIVVVTEVSPSVWSGMNL